MGRRTKKLGGTDEGDSVRGARAPQAGLFEIDPFLQLGSIHLAPANEFEGFGSEGLGVRCGAVHPL